MAIIISPEAGIRMEMGLGGEQELLNLIFFKRF